MDFLIPNPDELRLGLRVLKTVAMADGDMDDAERAVLDAARSMFGADYAIDELAPITFEDFAAAVRPEVRQQLFGGVLVVCMSDGEVNDAESRVVRDYASACGIEDGAVANMRRLARGEFRRARLDIIRRQWAPKKLREMAEDQGASVYFKAVAGMLNLRDDPAVTKRYLDLGELPTGTLGRGYFEYMTENEFPFPGERGAPPEAMVFHDMTHILSGYGTDPRGEILAASFSAGYSSYEVFNWFMFVLSQFQLGLPTAPNVPPATMALEPRELIAAMRRGAAMNIDINVGWDYWEVIDQPVDTLRERYGILPHEHYLRA